MFTEDWDTHLADGLELLVVVVVAGQQEAPVGARPLAFAQVGADHTQVDRVAHPLQVVLLQLGRNDISWEMSRLEMKPIRVIIKLREL